MKKSKCVLSRLTVKANAESNNVDQTQRPLVNYGNERNDRC